MIRIELRCCNTFLHFVLRNNCSLYILKTLTNFIFFNLLLNHLIFIKLSKFFRGLFLFYKIFYYYSITPLCERGCMSFKQTRISTSIKSEAPKNLGFKTEINEMFNNAKKREEKSKYDNKNQRRIHI